MTTEQWTASIRQTARNLWQDDKGPMLVAIAAGWFLSIGVRMIFPALLPNLRAAYGLSLAMGGFLITCLTLAYAWGQLPGGVLADRFGEGNILVISTFLSAITVLFVVLSNSTFVLFGATVLFGFATGLYGVSRFTTLSDIYDEQVGAATGVTLAAGDGGQSLLPPTAAFIAVGLTWQLGFGFTIPLFVLVGLAIWWIVPASTSGPTSAVDSFTRESAQYVLAGLRTPPIVRATIVLFVGNCIWQAFTAFYPTYLIEMKGLSPGIASSLFGLFFVVGIVVKPFAGNAFDKIGVRRSLVAFLVVSGIAFLALPSIEGVRGLIAVTILAGFLLGYGTILLTYLTTSLPTDMQGTGLGFIRTVYWTIGAASPVLFGLAAEYGYFDEGYYVLAALAGLMLILAQWIPELDHDEEVQVDV